MPSILRNVAVISQTAQVSLSQLALVTAAIQKQITRDVSPIWAIEATVDAFERLDQVPIGYWSVIIRGDIASDQDGLHHHDVTRQPFALVRWSLNWSLTVSHECIEMLIDPWGSRVIAGNSVKRDQGRVEYLVEVCDPCESATFGYSVNSILVSDFLTPQYFDPLPSDGVRYSFTGSLAGPRDVLEGGYLTWLHPTTGHVWQLSVQKGKRRISDLGPLPPELASMRRLADRAGAATRTRALAAHPRRGLRLSDALGKRRARAPSAVDQVVVAAAGSLQERINILCR